MNTLITLILDEVALILALGIVILLLIIWEKLRKRVVVPSLTVVVDKASYLHGDTVAISGNLKENDAAVADAQVTITLPDSTTTVVTTDTNGTYSATWVVPDTVAGVLTVSVAALGIMATTTFTLRVVHPHYRHQEKKCFA